MILLCLKAEEESWATTETLPEGRSLSVGRAHNSRSSHDLAHKDAFSFATQLMNDREAYARALSSYGPQVVMDILMAVRVVLRARVLQNF